MRVSARQSSARFPLTLYMCRRLAAGPPDPPMPWRDQHRLVGPDVEPDTGRAPGRKGEGHDARLVRPSEFQIAVVGRDLNRQPLSIDVLGAHAAQVLKWRHGESFDSAQPMPSVKTRGAAAILGSKRLRANSISALRLESASHGNRKPRSGSIGTETAFSERKPRPWRRAARPRSRHRTSGRQLPGAAPRRPCGPSGQRG